MAETDLPENRQSNPLNSICFTRRRFIALPAILALSACQRPTLGQSTNSNKVETTATPHPTPKVEAKLTKEHPTEKDLTFFKRMYTTLVKKDADPDLWQMVVNLSISDLRLTQTAGEIVLQTPAGVINYSYLTKEVGAIKFQHLSFPFTKNEIEIYNGRTILPQVGNNLNSDQLKLAALVTLNDPPSDWTDDPLGIIGESIHESTWWTYFLSSNRRINISQHFLNSESPN